MSEFEHPFEVSTQMSGLIGRRALEIPDTPQRFVPTYLVASMVPVRLYDHDHMEVGLAWYHGRDALSSYEPLWYSPSHGGTLDSGS